MSDCFITDIVLMISRRFICLGIPLVLLYHRTVIFTQFLCVGQRHTYNFPSVIIQQDNLWLKAYFLKCKQS